MMLETFLAATAEVNRKSSYGEKSIRGNVSFIGRTDADAETPILWPPDANWLIGKDPDAGKDWGQEEKGVTEDKMVGWHHNSMDMSLSKLQEMVTDREAWCAVVHGAGKSQTLLSDWTELNLAILSVFNLT